MLWTLLKVLIFVAVVAALAFAADIMLRNGQGMQVIVAGREFTLGPLQTAIGALLLVGIVWLLVLLIGVGTETAIAAAVS